MGLHCAPVVLSRLRGMAAEQLAELRSDWAAVRLQAVSRGRRVRRARAARAEWERAKAQAATAGARCRPCFHWVPWC